MTYKNSMGVFPYKTASHISLLKYTKSACGVDFMLNTADSNERQGWFNSDYPSVQAAGMARADGRGQE